MLHGVLHPGRHTSTDGAGRLPRGICPKGSADGACAGRVAPTDTQGLVGELAERALTPHTQGGRCHAVCRGHFVSGEQGFCLGGCSSAACLGWFGSRCRPASGRGSSFLFRDMGTLFADKPGYVWLRVGRLASTILLFLAALLQVAGFAISLGPVPPDGALHQVRVLFAACCQRTLSVC